MAYTPPRGILNPSVNLGFEIDIAVPADPPSWPSAATAGYGYIDNTHPSATNVSNPYGYPDKPRLDFGSGVAPGSTAIDTNDLTGWVKICCKGTFSRANPGMNYLGTYQFGGTGTASNPIFICAADNNNPPLFARLFDIGNTTMANFVFDHIDFGVVIDGSDIWRGLVDVRPRGSSSITCQNIVFRHGTGRGNQDHLDANCISIGGSSNGVGVRDFDTQNVVVWDYNIADYGDWTFIGEQDSCGVFKNERSTNVWVLNCEIFHVGGDGVAGSPLADDGDYKSTMYWIGGNTLYECGENGCDLKCVNGIAFIENDVSGPNGEQQGTGFMGHTGGTGILVQNVAVCRNTFHHLSSGAALFGSPALGSPLTSGIWFMDNVFYDIRTSIAQQPDNQFACMSSASGTGVAYFVDNTCYEYEMGIYLAGPTLASFSLYASGNIFRTRLPPPAGVSNLNVEWAVEDSKPVDVADFNCYDNTAEFYYNGAKRNIAYMQGQGFETNSLSGDNPDFVDAPNADFNLDPGSPCVDTGTLASAAYDSYEAFFGVSIQVDRAGIDRPQGSENDIGAYEYDGTPNVANPQFSPVGGNYFTTQNVSISTTTPGATIHYTTNGANPTTGSPVYSVPLVVAATTTIKALAVKAGLDDSAIVTAVYNINSGVPGAPPNFRLLQNNPL